MQLLLMLIATYKEALGLSKTYRLTTVRETLMMELKYSAQPPLDLSAAAYVNLSRPP